MEHHKWKQDDRNAGYNIDEERGHYGQGEGLEDSLNTRYRRPSDQNNGKLCCQPRRRQRAPVFPPVKPSDIPGQQIVLAQDLCIKQLSSRVQVLQQQLNIAIQDNQLLQDMQRKTAAALHCFQSSQASLPRLLHMHRSEVQKLQELLRKSKMCNNTLSQKLWSKERELLHACDDVQRLQFLSQDKSLEEREVLTRCLKILSVDLDEQNERVQDLEKNLALIHGTFNCQLSAEIRRTMKARELSRHLEKEISNLTQNIKDIEKELEIHNIYSNRFHKRTSKEGKKDNKSVQTDATLSFHTKALTCPFEAEYLLEHQQKEHHEKNNSQEFNTSETTNSSRSENEPVQIESEDTSNEILSDNKENIDLYEATKEHDAAGEKEADSISPALTFMHPVLKEIDTQLDEKSLLKTQSNSTPKIQKSLVRIRRHYCFKETILNLHCGKPAYGTSFHMHKKNKTTAILDTGVYEPSFGVPVKRPNPTREQPDEETICSGETG